MASEAGSRAQEALTVEELDALLAEAAKSKSPTGRRNLALLTLMADTGLRIGEALALTTGDLLREAGQIVGVKVRHGKGNTQANLAVTTRAAARLARWLAAREKLGLGAAPVFCTISEGKQVRGRVTADGFGAGREVAELTPGRAISPEYVRQVLTRLGKRAGIERRLTPHTLRHTFATHLLQNGTNLAVVSKAMRHAHTSTTAEIYAHLQDEDVANAVRALRPEEAPDKQPTSEAEVTLAARIAAMTPEERAVVAKLLGGGE